MCDLGSTFETRPMLPGVSRAHSEARLEAFQILLVFYVYSLTSRTIRYRVSGMTSQIRTSPIGTMSAGAPRRRLLPSNAAAPGDRPRTLDGEVGAYREPPSSRACRRSMSSRPQRTSGLPTPAAARGGAYRNRVPAVRRTLPRARRRWLARTAATSQRNWTIVERGLYKKGGELP